MPDVLTPFSSSKTSVSAGAPPRPRVRGTNFDWYFWTIALLMAGAVGLHVFMALYPFPLSGHDAHSHLDWIEEFNYLRDIGIRYPRWLPLSFGGFGATTFYFYPPLTYFLGNFYHTLDHGLSITGLYHLLELSAVIASIIGTYVYLRENSFSRRASWLAGALVGTALYRFWDVFMRNALAEQMAIACIPFVLLSIDYSLRSERQYRLRATVLGALAWGSLILTNIPTLVLLLISAPVYALVRAKFRVSKLVPAVSGALLGALLSSIYILPMLELRRYMRMEVLFDFIYQWAMTLQEFWLPWITKTGMHFIVPATLAAGLAAILYFAYCSKRSSTPTFLRSWIALGGLALFLQLPYISLPVWNNFPPLQLIQFSWRWCGVLLYVPAIASALVIDRHTASSRADKLARISAWVYAAVAFFWYVRYAVIVLTFAQPPPMVDPGRTGAPEHIPSTAYFSSDARTSELYAIHRMDEPAIMVDTSDVRASLVSDSGVSRLYRVQAPHAFHAHFHLYYWPLWRLVRGGEVIRTEPDAHGIMTATLPAGSYELTLTLEDPPHEQLGMWLSLLGVAMLCGLCCVGFFAERNSKTE